MRRLTAVLLGLPLALLLGWASWPTAASTTVNSSLAPYATPKVEFSSVLVPVPARSVPKFAAAEQEQRIEQKRINEENFYAALAERNKPQRSIRSQTTRSVVTPQKPKTPKPAANTERPEPTGDIWWKLAGCETGGKYDNPNTGNGYYGYFQFSLTTWRGVDGPGYPHEHSYDVQLQYAKKLQARDGWGQWPGCARRLGLR